jgi:hypothetical protein
MILARAQKNHTQARARHDPSPGCRNQKWQVLLEVGGADVRECRGACAEVGLHGLT